MPPQTDLPRDLGDGLRLRRATVADAEALTAFNVGVHSEHNPDDVGYLTYWMQDLMGGVNPVAKPRDFTLVEDTRTGAIVSSLNLISQTWNYGGVKLGVGRPELVGTDPEYRRRGLVAKQFDVMHGWSEQRGELAQAITGIPDFYRQFGYEMTLPLGIARSGHKSQVPRLAEGAEEPFRVRPATARDLPFVGRTYEHGMARYLVSAHRSQALWRYELQGRNEKGGVRVAMCVIESQTGKRVGFLAHHRRAAWGTVSARAYELAPGVSWLAVTPSVLRYLVGVGERYAAESKVPLEWVQFNLDTDHPVYAAHGDMLARRHGDYAYYLRVPDLARFLRHVAPVLEARLATSIAVGYRGELRIWCYRRGVRLVFAKGKLVEVDALTSGDKASATFTGETLLHLLFGHRTLDEITHLYADSHAHSREAKLLLGILFPKQPSHVWVVE